MSAASAHHGDAPARDELGFQCARCGRCCRTIRVPLTDVDLWRLAEATALPPATLVEWLAPDAIDMTGEPETFVRLPEGRRLMVLGHANGGCRFLHAEQCSVHPARPTACRAFPFFVEDGRPGLLPDVPCDPPEPPPQAALTAIAQQLTDELARYAERVGVWNRRQRARLRLHRRPATVEEFYAFLRALG